MVQRIESALLLALAVAVLCVSVGCGTSTQPAASLADSPSVPLPSVPQASSPQSPSASVDEQRQYAYRLPGMECLVNKFGIRRKVIITRRGLRCTDRTPGGTIIGPELKFFTPYFVFEVVPPQGKVEYFQIGTTPRNSSVLGWLSAADAAEWDTRVGARYLRSETTRVPPLLVYESDTACEDIIKTGSTSAKPIARPLPRATHAWMPWPIAETRTFTFNGKSHELVRLEFLGTNNGNLQVAGPTGDAQPAYSEGEVATIKDKVKMLDVVFCVDTTHSMQPNINAMIAAIESIVNGLKDLPFRPDVNFGLVEYRDYVRAIAFRENGKLSVVKVYPLYSDVNAFLEIVRPLKEAKDGSEDLPEAVYDGVQAALVRTNWRGEGLSARAVVLIGDNSGHEPGHRKNPKKISADDLIKTARSPQTNARIFSLCIEGAGGPEEQTLHKAQFTKLAEETGGSCFSLDEADKVVEQICNIMETETAVVHKRSVVVDALAAGKTTEQIVSERQASGGEIAEVMEFLQGAGVEVARLRPGVPAYATGWCLAEVDGVPLLNKEVYMARAELDRLLSELNELCVHLSSDFARQTLQVGIESRVANPLSFFAEHRPEPMDVFLMAKGIPCSQGMLRLTRAEIEHMPEEQRAVLREKIARQVVPQLTNARNNNQYFTWLNDLEFGWIPESLLP